MKTIFSKTLTRLRSEAGFTTAYRFFHDNGGARVLGMSYSKYQQLEEGEIPPQLDKLRILVTGLRLIPAGGPAKELVTACLKTLAGDEVYDELLKPALNDKPPMLTLSPTQEAMKEVIAARKFHITPERLDVITALPESYACFQFITSDLGAWTAERLAKSAGIPKATAGKIIKSFLEAKLLRRAGKGFTCPLVEAEIELPHKVACPELYKRLEQRHDELVASGRQVWFRRTILRADENALRDFFQLMAANLASVTAYSVNEKTPASAMFAMEVKATKLRDF